MCRFGYIALNDFMLFRTGLFLPQSHIDQLGRGRFLFPLHDHHPTMVEITNKRRPAATLPLCAFSLYIQNCDAPRLHFVLYLASPLGRELFSPANKADQLSGTCRPMTCALSHGAYGADLAHRRETLTPPYMISR